MTFKKKNFFFEKNYIKLKKKKKKSDLYNYLTFFNFDSYRPQHLTIIN